MISYKIFYDDVTHECHLGSIPLKLLFEKSKYSRDESLKIEEGMVPVKELFCRDNVSNSARFPSSCGISPENYN